MSLEVARDPHVSSSAGCSFFQLRFQTHHSDQAVEVVRCRPTAETKQIQMLGKIGAGKKIACI
ncbi:MAG: hypothetical protein DMG60_22745 [Acidobacteria bacterium]|nr:MAG: hypothetical protein DMG60_22745 [Acidobacteriota bacterium]